MEADNRSPRKAPQRLLLRAITRAVGGTGTVKVTVAQNRHMEEERPDWTLRIDTVVDGAAVAIENDGPSLLVALQDAGNVLTELGMHLEIESAEDERQRMEAEDRA